MQELKMIRVRKQVDESSLNSIHMEELVHDIIKKKHEETFQRYGIKNYEYSYKLMDFNGPTYYWIIGCTDNNLTMLLLSGEFVVDEVYEQLFH